jgi:hypothetical protein
MILPSPTIVGNGLTSRVDRSRGRATGVRLPATFVRGDGRKPMLSELLRGGRGGEVRLKLYLSTVLLAGSKHSHEIHGKNTIVDVSGPTWARALALPDPAAAGARRVADAQNQLASKRLIKVNRRPGQEPRVQLLHPSGSTCHHPHAARPVPPRLLTGRESGRQVTAPITERRGGRLRSRRQDVADRGGHFMNGSGLICANHSDVVLP